MRPFLGLKVHLLVIPIVLLVNAFGYGQKAIEQKNLYLIVLDVQEIFIEDKVKESDATEFLNNVNSVVQKFDPKKVVYVNTDMVELRLSFKGASKDTIQDLAFAKELVIVNSNKFIKADGNAFSNTQLVEYFQNETVTDVLIVGLAAEKCVTHSTMGGIEQGFTIYITPEAVLGKNQKSKLKAIDKMQEQGVKVISLNDL